MVSSRRLNSMSRGGECTCPGHEVFHIPSRSSELSSAYLAGPPESWTGEILAVLEDVG